MIMTGIVDDPSGSSTPSLTAIALRASAIKPEFRITDGRPPRHLIARLPRSDHARTCRAE